jgi:16S rRNA U516 pseudouridylate synthase RsuA-like enzyme
MVEAVGHAVKKLKRIRIENIDIGDLKEGEFVKLTSLEREQLLARTVFANSRDLG